MCTFLKSSAGATSDAGGGPQCSHISIYSTLQIGHTIQGGDQRLQCWLIPVKKYYEFNWQDLVLTRPPGVEQFVLSLDNVWYGRLKLLFTLSVHIDGQAQPVEPECAYVLFFYEIKLEPSGMQ